MLGSTVCIRSRTIPDMIYLRSMMANRGWQRSGCLLTNVPVVSHAIDFAFGGVLRPLAGRN